MKEFYEELFLKKVAEGRNKSVEEIRELAEGRVWTGNQALGNGLVDEAGGARRAIELARERAGLAVAKPACFGLHGGAACWIFCLCRFSAHLTLDLQGPLFLMSEDWDITEPGH